MKSYTLLLALLCVSCAGTKNLNTASQKSKIIQICQKQVDSWRVQSLEGETEVWGQVPYAMKMLTNGTQTVGWDQIRTDYYEAFQNSDLSQNAFKTELNDFWVHISGKTAWVIFDQHQIFPNDMNGRNDIYESLEMRILEYIDGKWQIVLQLTGPYDKTFAAQTASDN